MVSKNKIRLIVFGLLCLASLSTGIFLWLDYEPTDLRYPDGKPQEVTQRNKPSQEDVAKEQRRKKIDSLFDPWDGSHINLVKEVNDQLKDPTSFEHLKTTRMTGLKPGVKDPGKFLVIMEFLSKNSFGAKVRMKAGAFSDYDGIITELTIE